MVYQLYFVLVFVLVRVGFRHLQKHADVGVLSHAVTPRVQFESPLDPVDYVGLRVGDPLVSQQVLLHLVGESLVFGHDLLSISIK